MTDKMREEFERDHEAALREIHYCPETDRYVAVDDSDGYALDYAVAMNNEWRVHKRAWQAARTVPDVRCKCCGYLVTESEHRGCLRAADVTVPEGWKLVPSRCPLCEYQHGHRIGCDNNPVDIALRAAAPAPKEEGE